MPLTIKKSKDQIKAIAKTGRIVANCHEQLKKHIVSGMKTSEIDQFIDWYLTEHGATPAQKGYKGYPYASCISVNEVACHGFPSHVVLKEGDIVTVDFVADVDGWKADSAWTYIVGNGSEEAQRLLRSAKRALDAGVKAAKAGNQISAIGAAIEESVHRDGFKVVTAFAGHGIGKQLHEPPQVLHANLPQAALLLEEGMVMTIEPIISAGSPHIYIAPDGWTARTIDHSLTAQFEHTLVITKGEPLLLTALPSQARKAQNKNDGKRNSRLKRANKSNEIRGQKEKKSSTPRERQARSTPLMLNSVAKGRNSTKTSE